MSKLTPILASSLLSISLPSGASEAPKNHQNFTGSTGLVNTPSAKVLAPGVIDIGYNNQLNFRGLDYVDGYNYIFSAGMWPGLEISGQISSSSMHDNGFLLAALGDDQVRDLSFNAKYQIPFVPEDWFDLAIGGKDMGGAANHYESYFAVASKDWLDFRFSTGVSTSKSEIGMMDGVFAGVEWQPLEWFALQLEHDAEAVNAAARVTVPKAWLFDLGTLTLTSRFYSNTEHSERDTYYGINFSMPLSEQSRADYQEIKPAPDNAGVIAQLSEQGVQPAKPPRAVPPRSANLATKTQSNALDLTQKVNVGELNTEIRALKQALVADGFENVQVGMNREPVIVVKFENPVFNRNDLDAIGVVLGRVAQYISDDSASYTVQLSKHDIPLLSLSGQVDSYRQFITEGTSPGVVIRQGMMDVPGGVAWIGDGSVNSPYFKPRLTLGPALSSTYATELGVYDFSLALRADLEIPLWRGAGVNITAQTVVADTEHFEAGGIFEARRERNGLERAIFYQTLDLPFGLYNQTQVGFFREYYDYTGIINETAWISPSGRHKLYNTYGFFDYQDYNEDRDYHVMGYQYHWVEQDISFHLSGGEFWRRDKGMKVETKFWFGDSYVSVYAYDTDVQVAGISFSIPLTPRKDMAVSKYGQVKGNQAWRHSVGTRIGENKNALVYKKGYIPETSVSLDRTYFNQGRLSGSYVYANLARLREAYLTFK
ncbi:YjbH domain-containing protein [Pseudoalteromonas sp. DL2-H2.2]|uniref:YjbH domain-containing protein n=1 Tax=Pseudoalteromonas sp. DL2-H2.2 TaxID=2908889 RepID=UPI001F1D1C6B|nr:YjbH domain-containing protein [Pseudoalteromonas sp. DL2-H2.2]MCF2908854.1 YjbH domain-containing protein [Pseudoalteromonas sp. DL2-H2.2]